MSQPFYHAMSLVITVIISIRDDIRYVPLIIKERHSIGEFFGWTCPLPRVRPPAVAVNTLNFEDDLVHSGSNFLTADKTRFIIHDRPRDTDHGRAAGAAPEPNRGEWPAKIPVLAVPLLVLPTFPSANAHFPPPNSLHPYHATEDKNLNETAERRVLVTSLAVFA